MGHARKQYAGAILTLGLVLVLSAASCEESGGPGETGLPEDALLISLTGDQWQTFCTVADDISRRPPEDECHRLAFSETRHVAEGSDADVRATCQARYDACVRDIRPPVRRGPICAAGQPQIDCSATVADGEQCLMAIAARRVEDRGKIPSCGTVTAAEARSTAGTSEITPLAILLELPGCQPLQQKCAGLIR